VLEFDHVHGKHTEISLLVHKGWETRERDVVVLDFDHLDGKVANVSLLVRIECRLATVVSEIARCEVRCANCRRRRTRERGGT
jgi:hypothetical protein